MVQKQLLNEIKIAILKAEKNKCKKVEVHYQILKNADILCNMSSEDFCREFNLSKGYNTEFKNMLKLAKRIKQEI